MNLIPPINFSSCLIEEETANSGFSLIPVALAARERGFQPGQCTEHVDQIYHDQIRECLTGYEDHAYR